MLIYKIPYRRAPQKCLSTMLVYKIPYRRAPQKVHCNDAFIQDTLSSRAAKVPCNATMLVYKIPYRRAPQKYIATRRCLYTRYPIVARRKSTLQRCLRGVDIVYPLLSVKGSYAREYWYTTYINVSMRPSLTDNKTIGQCRVQVCGYTYKDVTSTNIRSKRNNI